MNPHPLALRPRQSAWARNPTPHDDADDIDDDDDISNNRTSAAHRKHIPENATESSPGTDDAAPRGHAIGTRPVHPINRPVHRTVPGCDAATQPAITPASEQSIELTTKRVHGATPHSNAVQTAQTSIVSSAQPVQRTKAGFLSNSSCSPSYPPSYVGAPTSTTGVTIGWPTSRPGVHDT